MGVPGLKQLLYPLARSSNFYEECSGKRVAIDGHVLLHKLLYSFSADLLRSEEEGGPNYDGLARTFVFQGRRMLGRNVTPIFVFDGAPMAAKSPTNDYRTLNSTEVMVRCNGKRPAQNRIFDFNNPGTRTVRVQKL